LGEGPLRRGISPDDNRGIAGNKVFLVSFGESCLNLCPLTNSPQERFHRFMQGQRGSSSLTGKANGMAKPWPRWQLKHTGSGSKHKGTDYGLYFWSIATTAPKWISVNDYEDLRLYRAIEDPWRTR